MSATLLVVILSPFFKRKMGLRVAKLYLGLTPWPPFSQQTDRLYVAKELRKEG